MEIREHKEKIFELAADRLPEILPELEPKLSSSKTSYTLLCPSCKRREAFYYKNNHFISCPRQNKCGYSVSLLDYLQARDSWPVDFMTMLRNLADMLNYSLPSLSPEAVEKINDYHSACRDRQSLFNVCRASYMFSDGSAPLKEYLKSRGWSDRELEEISDVGFFDRKLIETAVSEGKLQGAALKETTSLMELDRLGRYPLIIPWRSADGLIKTFILRAIDKAVAPKYLVQSGGKKDEFFNIHTARTTRTDEIYIVEGVIDALRLTAGGLSNVVGLGNASLNSGHVEQLKRNKFKHIVLMLDNDEAGITGTQKAVELLNKNGFYTYFVSLPSGIKDPDDFLRSNKTVKELKELNRLTGLEFIVRKKLQEAGTDDLRKNKALDDILFFVEEMPDDLLFDSKRMFDLFLDYGFSTDKIEKKISEIMKKKSDNAAKLKTISALKNATREIENGRSHIDVMSGVMDVQKTIQLEHFVNTFEPYTFDMLKLDCINTPPALELDYTKWGAVLSTHVKIQNGSLVLVAGRPRHGKTTFLLNMAASMCDKYPDKTFVFISYEEQARDIGIKLISILAGPRKAEDLQSKLAIEAAFRNNADVSSLRMGIEKFETYTRNERLLFDCKVLGITELCNHINFFKNNYPLGAVFVDYIQKIPGDKNSSSFSRQNEIQNISGQLLETARSNDIPIILGAQLNRETDKRSGTGQKNQSGKAQKNEDSSKFKIKLSDLRESGDLEQDANVVLGIYNSDVEDENSVKLNMIDVLVLKNRNGVTQIQTKLKWHPAEYVLRSEHTVGKGRSL